jgi:choice-of-anchor A domain-containing protein
MTGGTINGSADIGTGVIFAQTGGSITGGVNKGINLSSDASAAVGASTTFAGLAATQTFGAINGTTTINASPGLNVIDLSGINLAGKVLTLNGLAGSEVVLNDSGGITLSSGQIVLTGGLTANDVVFNVNGAVTMTGGVLDGTILAPNASVTVTSGSVDGELIGGKSITLSSGQVVGAP